MNHRIPHQVSREIAQSGSRLALASLVVSSANVLLLDEPTNNLDPASRAEVLAAIKSYAGAVVLVTHDEEDRPQIKLIDLGIPRWRLKGSYAGATGYPQFMPSVVLRLRADGGPFLVRDHGQRLRWGCLGRFQFDW